MAQRNKINTVTMTEDNIPVYDIVKELTNVNVNATSIFNLLTNFIGADIHELKLLEDTNTAIFNIGIGNLIITFEDDDLISYSFEPSKLLTKAITTNQDELNKKIDTQILRKLSLYYKLMF